MSKSSGKDHADNLRTRIAQAQREQRWKDAIEFARQLIAADPSEANRKLQQSAALGFLKSLADRGRTRDLSVELPRMVALFPGDAAWATQLSEVAVRAGLVAEGLKLLPPGAAEEQNAKLRIVAVDAAVRAGQGGRASLPADLHADHERVLKAFALVEQGKDDAARTELQGIGLRSPFAEWRLFLRGLQAYYANDDARAIEAWARLAADRVPFRLAAPFRYKIDATFRAAQAPELHAPLQRQFDTVSNPEPLGLALKRLQRAIAEKRGLLAEEFRAVHNQDAALKALPPELLDRLSRAVYWAIGDAPPEVHQRYRSTFKPPREDPTLRRLAALYEDRQGDPYRAITLWQDYEKQIASDATLWGEDTTRVRALLWVQMGDLAGIPPEELLDEYDFNPFGTRGRKPQKPPQPPLNYATCYQRARELAPDLVTAYLAPTALAIEREDYTTAQPLAEELRTRFPDNVDAQMTAARVFADLDEIPAALACIEQAARVNPLDQTIQLSRRAYALSLVTYHLRGGRFADARAAVAAARILCVTPGEQNLLAIQEATIAWKEGDAAALPKLRADLATKMDRAGLIYTLVIQANLAKIDRKSKAPLDKEFTALLAEPLTLAEAMTLGHQVRRQELIGGAPYVGFKTQRGKIVKQLARFADAKELTARQALDLGILYRDLKMKRPLGQLAGYSSKRIPEAVKWFLRYFQALDRGRLPPFGGPPYELQYAEREAENLPDAADRAYLKSLIEAEKKEHDFGEAIDPFGYGPFGGFGEPEDEFDDDDEGFL